MEVTLLSIGFPPYFTFGGAEIYMKLLSEELSRSGINVTVISGWPRKEIQVEKPGDNLKIIRLPVIDKPIRTFWFQLFNKQKILNILQKADIVHANSSVLSSINEKILNSKPLITSLHGSPDSLWIYFQALKKFSLSAGDFLYLMEYPFLKTQYFHELLNSDALIFVADHAYHEALKYLGDKSSSVVSRARTIYPGINLEGINLGKAKVSNNSEMEVAYVGRLFWPKGVTYALEAFNIMVNELGERKAKLHVFGDGPLKARVVDYVKKHNLLDNVKIYGQVRRDFVMRTLSNTNGIIHPSLYEGCPFVLMEANALGVPVVAFDFPWSKEFIKNGLNGYRSPPYDVYKLAENTLKVTTLKSSLIKEDAKKFDIRITAKKTIETYQKIL